MTNKKLITGIDKKENAIQIKGLMSLVVMLGHIAPFMGNFYYILSGGIAVGIFFYYSSFGSRISLKNKNYFKDFFKKKVIKIFIPYIIANDIYFISTAFQKDFKLENSISSVILQIIGLKLSNSVLWYVWHLMGFLVIFYLVEKYLKNQYTYVCMLHI